VASVAVTGRHDLSDVQWAVLEPLLPKGKRPGRPPRWSRRQLIDGIRWRIRVGVPWRDVPERYGSWPGPGRRCTGCFAAGSVTGPGHGS
jgi:transposase